MGQDTLNAILEALPKLIDQVGFFQFVILLLVLIFGLGVVKGKFLKPSPTKETDSQTVAPLVDAWGEVERSSLNEMRKDVEFIRDKVTVIEDRLRN